MLLLSENNPYGSLIKTEGLSDLVGKETSVGKMYSPWFTHKKNKGGRSNGSLGYIAHGIGSMLMAGRWVRIQ
jgi:hypothetical protein